jgi:SAM-dependent methyltransferase
VNHSAPWRRALELFFAERAAELGEVPSFADLCYVSGRDPRVWQPEVYRDMVDNILGLIGADPRAQVLEVGCAAGLIAHGLAPRVRRYTGIDLARAPLGVARRLKLPNATFRRADGAHLPFRPSAFDAVLCYDVFTNFPSFDDGIPIISEMLRTVRSGGRVLLGSIPDADCKSAYEQRVREFAVELDTRYGSLPARVQATRRPLLARLGARLRRTAPEIVCYYFRKQDFLALGGRLGARTEIHDVHRMNPYFGYRFNVVYQKLAS